MLHHTRLQVLYLWVSVFFLFVAFLGGCTSAPDTSEGPKEGPLVIDFPDTPAGNLVKNHVATAVKISPDAETAYQASLLELRVKGTEVVEVIRQAYSTMDEHRYFRRWLLVETLRELHSNDALDVLTDIASSPIPREWRSDNEVFSQDKEISIRATAVVGVADLASRGNETAQKVLTSFFSNEELAIRRAAIRGYLGGGEDYDARKNFLKKTLPEKDHPLITLDVTEVKRIPHPDIPEDLQPGEVEQGGTAPKIKREEKQ